MKKLFKKSQRFILFQHDGEKVFNGPVNMNGSSYKVGIKFVEKHGK